MARKDRQKTLEYYREYNLKRRGKPKKQARQTAIENGETHYQTGKPCKHGHISLRRVADRKCMACELQAKKANPRTVEQSRAQYIKHREKILAQKFKYRQLNKGKIIALATMRKHYIKERAPAWLTQDDKWVIKEIYELSALRSKMFGFKWHVDHIIPLRGKNVSGLHVPENLQVIPASINISKKNKYGVGYAE